MKDLLKRNTVLKSLRLYGEIISICDTQIAFVSIDFITEESKKSSKKREGPLTSLDLSGKKEYQFFFVLLVHFSI